MHIRLSRILFAGVSTAVIILAASASVHAQSVNGEYVIDLQPQTARPAVPPPVSETMPVEGKPVEPRPINSRAVIEPVVTPLAIAGQKPDESALRYYASLQQTRRVETEIKRISRLYPDWKPPENLSSAPTGGGVDEQPFWDLYRLNKIDELEAEIARRKNAEPDWNPSGDLMDKISRKKTRLTIANLWKSGKWKNLIAFVKDSDVDAGNAEVDIVWTIAEAYAKVKQTADALRLYKSVMEKDDEFKNRLATVQKAMSVLRMTDVEELIALARKDANGLSELEPIAIDITRGRISAYLHDERAEPIPGGELNRFEEYARKQTGDANQPGLVAWYHYKNKAFPQALEWFKFAIAQGGDAMIAHGLSHALRELGMYRETEEVSYAWRQPLVHNAILFIDILERDLTKEIPPYIEPHRLLRYAQVTMDTASGEGAQGLAWYAYNTCQFPVALEWFERAVAWLPKEATVYGYALALRRQKKMKEFWETLNRYDGLFPKVIDIIYPDGRHHPPTPCDLLNNKSAQQKYQQHYAGATAYSVPAPYVQGQPLAGGRSTYAAMQYPSMQYPGSAPAPQAALPVQQASPQLQYPGQQPWNGQPGYYANPALNAEGAREPKVDRKLFPVAVDPQNPLRHFPTGRFMGPPSPAAAAQPAAQTPLMREPLPGMRTLVARRVPDVGPMPYERWGYQLLPGYNGIQIASAPHDAVKAPEGTLWTTLQAKDAQATRGGALDPLRQDLVALIARLTQAPRVPPPLASTTGPWSSPKPYKSREQLEAESLPEPEIEMAGPVDAPAAPAAALPANRAAPLLNAAPAPQPQTSQPDAGVIRIHAADHLAQQANAAYNRKQYTQTLDILDQRARNLPENEEIKLMRAWSLLNIGSVEEARKIFNSLGPAARRAAASPAPAQTRTR